MKPLSAIFLPVGAISNNLKRSLHVVFFYLLLYLNSMSSFIFRSSGMISHARDFFISRSKIPFLSLFFSPQSQALHCLSGI